MQFQYIDTVQSLQNYCKKLGNATFLAIDTEFVRESTYFPQLGLVQIASEDMIVCIDPLAFDATKELKNLLLDTSITKVFHACTQDLEVLFCYLNTLVTPIFDTQIASSILSEDDQIGYAALVKNELNIELDKSQTRTNWLRRPLSSQQLSYAQDDVRYLLQIREQQIHALNKVNRLSWVQEELDTLCEDTSRYKPDPVNAWKKIKNIKHLSDDEFTIAQILSEWRETQAINEDVPRRRIVSDKIIIEAARNHSNNPEDLIKIISTEYIPGETQHVELLKVLRTIKANESGEHPEYFYGKLDHEQSKKLDFAMEFLKNKAALLKISQPLLCSRKQVEQLVLGDRNLAIFKGWRYETTGKELLELI